MFVLECKIEIGNYTFDQVVDVKITRSVDLLSDTAVIKLPTKFVLKSTKETLRAEDVIQSGMPVSITLGYKNRFTHTEFKGFVTSVKPNTPTEIHCEDYIWQIRRTVTINNSFNQGTSIRNILAYILKDSSIELSSEIPEIPVAKYVIKNKNGAQALMQLKQDFGLSIYLDDNYKLYAGLRQAQGIGKEVTYDLDYNIVSQKLTYVRHNDVNLKIVMKGMKPDNSYTQVEVTSDEKQGVKTHITEVLSNANQAGEVGRNNLNEKQEVKEYIMSSINDGKALAEVGRSKLMEQRFEGYQGNLKGFLIPFADRGMTAHIIDETYPEREGRYFIPKVVITFGTGGARRIVSLGNKLSTTKSAS